MIWHIFTGSYHILLALIIKTHVRDGCLDGWVGGRRCEHLQETVRGARSDGGMRRVFGWYDAPSGGHVGGG